MIVRLLVRLAVTTLIVSPAAALDRAALDALIAQHARANGVPEALVHRIVRRESGYNALASSRGNLGLMQIRHATARGMGYLGSAAGLLDANTNLTYAVPYLANAYRVAGGNAERAISLYTSGYYYEAKRKGLVGQLRTAITPAPAGTVAQPASPTMSPFSQTPAPASMQVLPASER